MKIKYFGTAAAEGVPCMFGCDCEVCKKSRLAGGKNIRTRTQALIDDRILIDFPPDTYMHVLYGGLSLNEIDALFITHSHSDHLYANDLIMNRAKGMCHFDTESTLNCYVGDAAANLMLECYKDRPWYNDGRIKLNLLEAFKTVNLNDYYITPLIADHDNKSTPYIFVISRGNKTMLWAHDTGWLPEKTWDYLNKHKLYFNYVSLDCTAMLLKGWIKNHLGLEECVKMRQQFMESGFADSKTTFCLNHFSHNGRATHDEFEAAVQGTGFIVSYDGMEREF